MFQVFRKNIMKKKRLVNNEQGFTLIEIIAVIIILGIMAAVAVPKFFSMQDDAKKAVLQGALSEGAVRFNHAYAKYILDNKKAPTGVDDLTTAEYLGTDAGTVDLGENIGDFNLIWQAGVADDELLIEVVTADTIGDALGVMLDSDKQKIITGIEWSPAEP